MPRNVEIKARVADFERLLSLAKTLSKEEPTLIEQEDTFFVSTKGRLKLRVLKGCPAQLIFYDRPDQSGPKLSDYHITEVLNPEQLKATLSLALGVKGVVSKKRWLYMVGQTRVHADQVQGLGSFMELEVVLRDDQTAEEGDLIAQDLMKKLEISPSQLLTCAYMDLILQQTNGVS